MATLPIFPHDVVGGNIVKLAKVSSVDMTTAAVFTVLKNGGPDTMVILGCYFHNMSGFADYTNFPATWACSWGSDSSTAPVNGKAAGAVGATPIPVILAQALNSTSLTPYLLPSQTLYFAVTTTTNGVGTVDVTFFGLILGH